MGRAEPHAKRRTAASKRSAKRTVADGFDLPLAVAPMEARTALALPEGAGWQYEPKWDGFRCIAFRAGEAVELRAKSGKPLGRYFPEVVSLLRGLAADRFVVDGELVIETQGRLSFDALRPAFILQRAGFVGWRPKRRLGSWFSIFYQQPART